MSDDKRFYRLGGDQVVYGFGRQFGPGVVVSTKRVLAPPWERHTTEQNDLARGIVDLDRHEEDMFFGKEG